MKIIRYTYFSEVWLVPRKTGGYIPATLRDPKAEVVWALNQATWGAPWGKSLKVYASDLSSVEIEHNVCRIRFANEGKNSILDSILKWSSCQRSVKLHSECRLQPAVLPVHEEFVKVHLFNLLIRFMVILFLVFNTSGEGRPDSGPLDPSPLQDQGPPIPDQVWRTVA